MACALQAREAAQAGLLATIAAEKAPLVQRACSTCI